MNELEKKNHTFYSIYQHEKIIILNHINHVLCPQNYCRFHILRHGILYLGLCSLYHSKLLRTVHKWTVL